MTEPTAEAAPPTDAEKKGRGPTRPAVKLADLVDELNGDAAMLAVLAEGVTAKDSRDSAKACRKQAKDFEKKAADMDAQADVLARVEELPAHLRRTLLLALSPETSS